MANTGITIFLGVILFNLIMYIAVYQANADSSFTTIGSSPGGGTSINASTTEDLSVTNALHWYDGFRISVFNLPWWMDLFYVTFQGVLITVSIYALIRGLS